ncbi:MAG TPA: hypothetical protein VHV51_00700 [Polyangiaceae bacterium]|jgi:hypothetical protein|nr:hypothetical protein [Polyangiaceae bacterium]
MNPIDARASDEDADLAAIVVPAAAKFGGGSLLLLGVLTLVLGLQTVLVVRRYEGDQSKSKSAFSSELRRITRRMLAPVVRSRARV